MSRIRLLKEEDIHTGSLILINRSLAYLEQKVKFGSGLPSTVCAAYRGLLAAMEIGAEIRVVSGYRSHQEQEELYQWSLQENGRAYTERYVALPGHSEHQSGLALDLTEAAAGTPVDYIAPSFPNAGASGAFRRSMAAFGFVERYPSGKEAVTGIAHEPWHIRYTGYPHSAVMKERGLTLEEYHDLIREYPYGKRELEYGGARIGFLPANREGETEAQANEGEFLQISGNNCDGFVLTRWR